ncbi:MAG: hypothetical protein HKN76_09725 [Saprospiraceae bacterium]|nr:hypothetical protein [Saprospiraceae bacterium]
MSKVLFKVLFITIIAILPFVVLIRFSVYLHATHHFFPLAAILGGFVVTFVILLLYVTFLLGPSKSLKRRLRLLALALLFYGVYAMLYVSAKNTKSIAVSHEYTSLHPVLRLGVSTLLLIDRSLIITDANRLPQDYIRMGLRSNSQSLHYRQSNGYVHALDIRTNGRWGIRNFLIKWYFKAMGFRVLRHGGTADHMHISLLSHDRPYAF